MRPGRDPRVLMISHDFKPRTGGEAEFAYALGIALRELGTPLRILAPPCREIVPDDLALGADLRRDLALDEFAPLRSLRGCLRWPAAMRALTRSIGTAIADQNTEICVVTSYMTWIAIALWLKRAPYVLVSHGEDAAVMMRRGPVTRRLFLRACNEARWLFFNSEFSRRQVVDAAPTLREKSDVLGCGVRTEAIHSVSMNQEQARRELGWGDEPVLITVATLVARKSIDTVIRALPMVLEAFPTCRYVIIGDGPERQALSELAEVLGVSKRVEFMGKVDDERKHLVYRSSDVFVMVSRAVEHGVQEGFGIVFLEANMHGLPVVGSRCGGIPDAVEDGVNGLLVDQRAHDQVAGAVVALLRDPARRSHLARAGQERVRSRFNWPSIAARVAQRLRQLVPEPLASEIKH